MKAYLFIKARAGAANIAAESLRNSGRTLSAVPVIGPWDVIATIEAAGINELGKLVQQIALNTMGVVDTMTCPILDA